MMTIPGKPPAPTNMVHHIGIAVRDIEASLKIYKELFGLESGPITEVKESGVLGCFLPVGETNLELLQATRPDSTIATFIEEHGEGLNHVCFEVAEVGKCLQSLDSLGISLIDHTPRRGLEGGLIGFLSPDVASGVLIELQTSDD